MNRNTFPLISLFCLFLSFQTLIAQDTNLPLGLENIATADSRPGWIKIEAATQLSTSNFINSLNQGFEQTGDLNFVLKQSTQDKLGTGHHLYQLTHQDIPVENNVWLFHENKGSLFLIQGNDIPDINNVSATPTLNELDGLMTILSQTDTSNYKQYAWDVGDLEQSIKYVTGDPNATHFPKGELVWVKDEQANQFKLAYRFDIYVVEPISKIRYYIDAHNRQIIKEIDLIATGCFEDHSSDSNHKHFNTTSKKEKSLADSPATGIANYVTTNGGVVNFTADDNGTDYTLIANNLGPNNNQVIETKSANNNYNYDNLTDIHDADNNWTDDATAIGAHWGTEKVYDYFLTKHNRNSFDGNGAPMISYVHYGSGYVNAFWNGVNMTYGDGDGVNWGALTSIDVIAHEIAHGVTENNGLGGLIYYSESGALNESFSDIFGAVVEFEYHPDGGDWLIGEDFDFANNNGFRNLANPSAEGDPATYYGTNWYTGFGDNAGVHTNSGVQNFWFYLLVNGGTGTNEYDYNYNVTGIGLEKAAAIAYRNLTTYMHSSAEFIDARDGAIQSAIDLYGDGSAEHLATLEAWCAVGVGTTCLPSITVHTPILNQFLINGTTVDITWSSTLSSIIPQVKIEYSTNLGDNATWTLITSGETNDGTYTWDIPNISGTTMRIRVSDDGNASVPRYGNPLIAGVSPYFNILPCSGIITFEEPEEVTLNVAATFTGLVPGDSFEWFINDVSIATTQDLTHTFTDYGVYTLTYVVENQTNNCFNTETREISIIPDNVCDARPIQIGTTYDGVFTGATVEPNEPSPPGGNCNSQNAWCHNTLYGSVWYSFVAPTSGIISIKTDGSDTQVALYEDIDCGLANSFQNAVLLAANDDNPSNCCGSYISKVCLIPGEMYYIQIDQYNPGIGPFTLIVNEIGGIAINPQIDESFTNCGIDDNWIFSAGNGHTSGIYSYSSLNGCFGCSAGIRGFGDTATSYIELPALDFDLGSPTYLFFDYAFVPKNDTVTNELRVEVGETCGSFSPLFTRTGGALATNNGGGHSNDIFYTPDCSEINRVQIDISALAGMGKKSIRFAAEGHFLNPIFIDNIFIGELNDTCRMLDSLVLVDIYNVTDGANWTNPWDLNEPLDSYYGVTLSPFGCVTKIDLDGNTDCLGCSNSGNNLTGTLPANFGNLIELKELSLSENNLTGAIPSSIGNLVKLESLFLEYNSFSGTLPPEVGNLVNLKYLFLYNNQIFGSLPTTFGNLISLEILNLSRNQITSIPTSLSNLTILREMVLYENQLTSLPDLSSLTNLYFFHIGNNSITGNFPAWINNLSSLEYLYAYSNEFTGAIPDLNSLTMLRYLNLGNNQLSGTIPDMSGLTNLNGLSLYNNQLEGDIPISLANLSNLYELSIANNNITGLIPNFSNATDINDLEVYDNQFTFEDILPNILVNEAVINTNSNYSWQDYDYDPQQKIGLATSYLLVAGNDYTFDLGIDLSISDNNYKWYKDGAYLQDIVGNNQLQLNSAIAADLGVYNCEVTNPGAPDLTLYSYSYSLLETIAPNDSVCNAITLNLDQTYTGTFAGASTEDNEPSTPGNDCNDSWCNSELNGSVWYSFVAPVNPYVSIFTNEVSNSNTKIALYEAIDCGASNPFENAVLLAANDYPYNSCCNESKIKLACLSVGETYYIQVEQYNSNQGDFNIIINSMAACELPCDLVENYNYSQQETCPGSADGMIDFNVSSISNHEIEYQLYDGLDNLISTSSYAYFTNLAADNYTIIAQSLDNATCSLSVDFQLDTAVDITSPVAICPSDNVNAAFVHSSIGLPWNNNNILNQMDNVFGSGKWHQLNFETVNVSLLFSNYYNVIYLEGSGENGTPLNNFMQANQQIIEGWVDLGNTLYINASTDYISPINLGFNGIKCHQNYSNNANVIATTHPIIVGPYTPTATTFTGNSLVAVAAIDKGILTATTLIESEDNDVLLIEADWGNGTLIIGTLSPSYWMDPSGEMFNIKTNILEYLKANASPASNPAIQLILDESLSASLDVAQINVGSTDECAFGTVALSKTSFNCDDLGFQNIALIATDVANNMAQCMVEIEIIDPNSFCPLSCPDELIIDMDDMVGNTYQGGVIKSAGTIYADTTVTFIAENSVFLFPGFHAKPNSTFTAKIGLCQEDFIEIPETQASSRADKPALKLPNSLTVRPNPFKQSTIIDYELNAPQSVFLALYSMGGQELMVLQKGLMQAGGHTKTLNAEGLKGGMYLVILQTEKDLITRKVILID